MFCLKYAIIVYFTQDIIVLHACKVTLSSQNPTVKGYLLYSFIHTIYTFINNSNCRTDLERMNFMNDIIRTKNLCKRYKETIALNNVSLHIPQGSIYGLIGNNGAGKTTLMRILSNLQSQSSGTIVKSESIKIGAIIETPALYPTLSAKGNLMYQLKICGCPSKEVKPKIAELLDLVHLKDTRKLVMNYSLGMRQRLALAMALVGNPQFLILDEPLNGLDPEGIKDVRAIIAKLNEEYGVTIMISSHILSELQKVANHYGFLKNGVLIQEFSSSEIADTDLETFYFKNFL